MDATTKWSLWAAGVGASFLVLEIPAIVEHLPEGKSSGTLTETLRSLTRDCWWRSSLFAGALVWLGGHVLAGWGPNNIMRHRPEATR